MAAEGEGGGGGAGGVVAAAAVTRTRGGPAGVLAAPACKCWMRNQVVVRTGWIEDSRGPRSLALQWGATQGHASRAALKKPSGHSRTCTPGAGVSGPPGLCLVGEPLAAAPLAAAAAGGRMPAVATALKDWERVPVELGVPAAAGDGGAGGGGRPGGGVTAALACAAALALAASALGRGCSARAAVTSALSIVQQAAHTLMARCGQNKTKPHCLRTAPFQPTCSSELGLLLTRCNGAPLQPWSPHPTHLRQPPWPCAL